MLAEYIKKIRLVRLVKESWRWKIRLEWKSILQNCSTTHPNVHIYLRQCRNPALIFNNTSIRFSQKSLVLFTGVRSSLKHPKRTKLIQAIGNCSVSDVTFSCFTIECLCMLFTRGCFASREKFHIFWFIRFIDIIYEIS